MPEYSIRDIARITGFSVGTVSRVLNNADNVSTVIRRRVEAVVRDINYQAGRRGRRPVQSADMGTAKEYTIALLSPGMSSAWRTNELWTTYLGGIEQSCRERHCNLIIYMADSGRTEAEVIADIISRADGVLLKSETRIPDYIRSLIDRIPVVGFGASQNGSSLPQMVLDNVSAGRCVTEKLLKLGHRRIAFLNHMPGDANFVARANGYVEVVKSNGCYDSGLLMEHGLQDTISLAPETQLPQLGVVLDRLLGMTDPPTAVAVANDWGALGLLQAASRRDVAVPERLSIAGIDDIGNLCELSQPTLSSVAMPFAQCSSFAVNLLCDMLDGFQRHQRGVPAVVYLPGEFRLRQSVRSINK